MPDHLPNSATARQERRAIRALARSPADSFWHGITSTLPLLLVIVPFGVLFGVTSIEAGLTLAQTMGFTTLVLAGASQFTAVQLLSDQVPLLLVILSGLAVNLRMAMYSASMVPWIGAASRAQKAGVAYTLIDQSYASSMIYYQANPRLNLSQRLAYFAGTAVCMCGPWVLATLAGALFGRAIPPGLALDFAVPITFLAMIGPGLVSAAHVAAFATSVLLALALTWLPAGLGLLIAAPLAMAAGAWTEARTERRKLREGRP
ncbi:MAG: AzlC family ABC transporter permease [Paracoccus sp. (in: a-proteobacteria)]|uniref:AzlC family ABC transporter permease n=1 Tax=Paracoccus sp. TaxID=267 RepID=UPI0026E0284E|nr:AzlC family ABC transporter permease [Paracoccus sp. (in: a-proteobacteria)]MDO5621452.1 AzlC family ABC transporter permease [Paracoccus sp. (in: a-proteobacteria)]